MPRIAHSQPPVQYKISVPRSLAARVDQSLLDPLRGKPRYGAMSDLVTRLLKEWIEKGPEDNGNPD